MATGRISLCLAAGWASQTASRHQTKHFPQFCCRISDSRCDALRFGPSDNPEASGKKALHQSNPDSRELQGSEHAIRRNPCPEIPRIRPDLWSIDPPSRKSEVHNRSRDEVARTAKNDHSADCSSQENGCAKPIPRLFPEVARSTRPRPRHFSDAIKSLLRQRGLKLSIDDKRVLEHVRPTQKISRFRPTPVLKQKFDKSGVHFGIQQIRLVLFQDRVQLHACVNKLSRHALLKTNHLFSGKVRDKISFHPPQNPGPISRPPVDVVGVGSTHN